jgi:TRAP-type mannitol/chloroaromatic compound transport system permease large subunit
VVIRPHNPPEVAAALRIAASPRVPVVPALFAGNLVSYLFTVVVARQLGPAAYGALGGLLLAAAYRALTWQRLQESIYLTVRTTAMVCWLFVGSWTFASVFSYLGGEQVVREFVVGLDMTPLQFLLLAQLIIFLLGWPLEWSEIIIIFVPIFLPLLPLFDIDPLFFGILIALNLQTSFLTPPMAMSAYYLKGIAPPHIRLTQIFAGSLPYVAMVFFTMFLLYVVPDVVYWLPRLFYGR